MVLNKILFSINMKVAFIVVELSCLINKLISASTTMLVMFTVSF